MEIRMLNNRTDPVTFKTIWSKGEVFKIKKKNIKSSSGGIKYYLLKNVDGQDYGIDADEVGREFVILNHQ